MYLTIDITNGDPETKNSNLLIILLITSILNWLVKELIGIMENGLVTWHELMENSTKSIALKLNMVGVQNNNTGTPQLVVKLLTEYTTILV